MHIILFVSGFDAWKTVFALVPTGDPSSQSSDTLMSLRAIPSFLAWLPDAAAEDICTSACIGIRGTLAVPPVRWVARWFRVCAPCLANWGGGGLSPVWSVAWWLVFCVWGGGGLSRFSVLLGGWKFRLVRRVFRKRPQGVTRTLSAAKQGGAERPGDGCPCVGAEETCGVAASTHKQ